MLRRKIETQLEAWRSAPKRTALLVTGARQIGKTYIIRHFAQQHYDHIAELNFIENPDLVALFDRPRDAKNLLMRLELAVNTPLVPGKTLIFFDEVQRCKEMVTAIKFLVDDGRFYKRNEHYYLAFASTCCPEGIGYAMSKNPLGPWEYKGHIMDHTPRTRGNHPGIIDYKGKSYCFGQNYDIFRLETSRHAERRSVSVAEMEYNPNGTIRMLPYFHECKLEQIEKFNPYRKVEAETMAWGFGLKTTPKNIWSHERWNQLVTSIDDGEYLMVKGVDFGKGAKTFKVSASAHLYGGILEIHIDQKDGPCVGTVNISHTKSELREFTTSVVNLNGVHDLYLVFKGGKELKKNLFMLDWWAFE